MQKGRKCVTFCINIIEQMTRHKKVDSESKMLSESILAKQNGITIKAAQSKISSELSWLKNLGNHKGK
ncbi:hypothetical protein FGO68_gene9371 [Halteria grandinella]|uniref:Uncharacterized protein n=1 Tax=Halteria grandinella TaxID=5974 RepID=A0A8J8NKZ5_HALGN|nr:hypothetical protein FGO68_gene9371 [Halteria grandinella]